MFFTIFCTAGYCSLDGIEKVSRVMCAAPKSRIARGTTSEGRLLKIVQCCPETPMMGGKHKQPSKYCANHALQGGDHIKESTSTLLPHEHRYFSKQMGEIELPDADDETLLVGCKKTTNVNRFYD